MHITIATIKSSKQYQVALTNVAQYQHIYLLNYN